jgi:hypothetical protein
MSLAVGVWNAANLPAESVVGNTLACCLRQLYLRLQIIHMWSRQLLCTSVALPVGMPALRAPCALAAQPLLCSQWATAAAGSVRGVLGVLEHVKYWSLGQSLLGALSASALLYENPGLLPVFDQAPVAAYTSCC